VENEEANVMRVERRFFDALLKSNSAELEQILSDDFQLIDVLSGSQIDKSSLLAALSSGQAKFETIDSFDSQIRFYQCTAVVIGSTSMSVRLADSNFAVRSRYTHIYLQQQDEWRLVSAQGTQITTTD
jgi:hypothetical protein